MDTARPLRAYLTIYLVQPSSPLDTGRSAEQPLRRSFRRSLRVRVSIGGVDSCGRRGGARRLHTSRPSGVRSFPPASAVALPYARARIGGPRKCPACGGHWTPDRRSACRIRGGPCTACTQRRHWSASTALRRARSDPNWGRCRGRGRVRSRAAGHASRAPALYLLQVPPCSVSRTDLTNATGGGPARPQSCGFALSVQRFTTADSPPVYVVRGL